MATDRGPTDRGPIESSVLRSKGRSSGGESLMAMNVRLDQDFWMGKAFGSKGRLKTSRSSRYDGIVGPATNTDPVHNAVMVRLGPTCCNIEVPRSGTCGIC